MTEYIHGHEPHDPTPEQLEDQRATAKALFAQQPMQRRATVDGLGGGVTVGEVAARNPRPEGGDLAGSVRRQKPHGEDDPAGAKIRRNRENVKDLFTHDEGLRKTIYFNGDGSTDLEYN